MADPPERRKNDGAGGNYCVGGSGTKESAVNDKELSQYKYCNAHHWYLIAPNFLETVGTNGPSTAMQLLGSRPATWLILLFHLARLVVNPALRGYNACCGNRRGRHAR